MGKGYLWSDKFGDTGSNKAKQMNCCRISQIMFSSTPNLPLASSHTQNKILTPRHCLRSSFPHFIQIVAQMSSPCPTHLKEDPSHHRSLFVPLLYFVSLLSNYQPEIILYIYLICFFGVCLLPPHNVSSMNKRTSQIIFCCTSSPWNYVLSGHMSYEFLKTGHNVKRSSHSFGHRTRF